jgi:hypothetical protein
MVRNDIKLWTKIDGEMVSHFTLREFESASGFVMLHPSVLVSLELVRRDLSAHYDGDVSIIVTNCTRTDADNVALARVLGWSDEGGLVARDSKHLAKWGGIAVDIKAVIKETGKSVPQKTLGKVCRRYFDWVKDDYGDGHVHADNRVKGTTK